MKWYWPIAMVVLAGHLMSQSMDSVQANAGNHTPAVQPPVLRSSEPADMAVFTLPGPPPKPAQAATVAARPPATIVRLAPEPADPDRPVLHRAGRGYPAEFESDSAEFLRQRIGQWTEAYAVELLGEADGQRAAVDDDGNVTGRVLAFSDPTNRYRELELDFDVETGQLRSVFVYPFSMTWQDCQRTFSGKVRAAQANKGRTFYSYLNRRLDVLVDPAGKVISLGMY